MNIKEFLNSPGIVVKNPNKKSKKDKQPSIITLPFDRHNTASIYSQANEEFDDVGNMLTDIEDPFKYDKHGITLTRKSTELKPGTEFRNLDFELADAQSNWTKAGNAILQTVVDEIIGGTIQGFSDLAMATPQALAKLTDTVLDKVFDIKGDKVQDALGMKDEDYSNPVSAKIEEWREKFRNEVAPIYTTPGVSIANGGFGDFGWWMSNVPSILSSITLFIPTRAATAGIGKLASLVRKTNNARKAERLINKLQKADKLANVSDVADTERVINELNSVQRFVNNPINRARGARIGRDISEGLLMRTIENYQEAHQTYKDVYADVAQRLSDMSNEEYQQYLDIHGAELQEDGIDVNDKDAVAKHIATKAADRTFAVDYSNVVFDVIQLHAIKDVGKLAKKTVSPSIMRMHRDSKKILNKTTEKAKETISKSRITKLGENLKDFATGSAKQFLAEASEGVEEGINYIASQEGITYGNTLLDIETDTTKSSFWNDRLADYLGDAEFYESAFWGVMGGVVFGGGMEQIQKGRIAYNNKKEEKRRKEKETTGEKVVTNTDKDNPLNDYIRLGELPAIKAAKESISKRYHRANNLKQQIELIKSGKHPFKTDNEGNPIDISGDEIEQAKATIEAVDKYISELAFDALNSGTYDLLVDYFKDKDVQKALIDMGATTENGIDEFVNKTLQTLDFVKQTYSKELAHVNSQVTAINASRPEEGKIPLEYVTHIARSNAAQRIKINRLDKVLAELNNQKARYADDEDPTNTDIFGTQNSIRLALLMNAYGRLEADKAAVSEDSELNDWQKEENLAQIRNQQDGLMAAILDVANSPYKTEPLEVTEEGSIRKANDKERALAAALYAIRASKTYKRVAKNIYDTTEDNPDYAKSDEELIADYSHIFGKSKTNSATLSQLAQMIDNDLASILDEDQERSLINVNKKLFDLYTDIANVEIQRGIAVRQLYSTQSQIREAVDRMHNRFNGIRAAKLDKAQKIIRKLHTKYATNAQDVERAVIAAYRNDRQEAIRLARETLTGTDENGLSDAEALIGALDVFNFSNETNAEAFRYIMRILQKNAEVYGEQEEINSIFQNQSSASQNGQLNNVSPSTSQANSVQGNTQNGQITPTNNQQQARTQTPVANVEVVVDDNATRFNNADALQNPANSVPVTQKTDSVYTLNVTSLDKAKQIPLILNPTLFGDITIDPLNNEVELAVVANPLLEKDSANKFYVARQGRVVAINKSTGEEIDAYGEPEVQNEEEGEEPPVNFEPADTESEEGQESGDDASISSTGEEVPIRLTTDQMDDHIAISIQRALNGRAIDDLSVEEIDGLFPAVKEPMMAGVKAGAFTEEELDEAIKDYLSDLKEDIADINDREGIDKDAARLALSARYEEPNSTEFNSVFTNAAKAFIEAYKKQAIVKEVNGKTAVKVRDIMSICSALGANYGDPATNGLYDIVVNYLLSPEGQAEYIILDAEDVYRGKVLDKLNKTSEQLLEEEDGVDFGETRPYRIDIQSLITTYRGDPEYFAAIKDLATNPNLEIEYSYDRYGEEILFKHTYNGKTIVIGRMPRPRTLQINKGNNNVLSYVNYSGWRVDTYINQNGDVSSDLEDFFASVFFNYNSPSIDPAAELKDIIIKYNKTGDMAAATLALTSNALIQQLIQQSKNDVQNGKLGYNPIFVKYDYKKKQWKPIDYDKLVAYMAHVFKYTYDAATIAPGSDVETQVRKNLKRWFRKIHDGYTTTVELLDLPNNQQPSSTKALHISDGEVNLAISVQDAKKEDAYDKCPLVSKALAPNTNAKVAIVSESDNSGGTMLDIADEDIENPAISGFSVSTTMLAITGPSGKPQWVHAFGRKIGGEHFDANEPVIPFGQAIFGYLENILTEIENAKTVLESEVARDKLSSFLNSLIAGKGIGVFRAKNGQTWINPIKHKNDPNRKGVEISYKPRNADKPLTFHIYTRTSAGVGLNFKLPGKKMNTKPTDASSVRMQLQLFLKDFYQFDISRRGIRYDQNNKMLGTGNDIFIPQPDGKLAVVIGPDENPLFKEEYDSYNDFIIKNDLIRVNTKRTTVDGVESNFSPTTDNQRGNRNILVELPTGEAIRKHREAGTMPINQQPASQRTEPTNKLVDKTSDTETFETLQASLPTMENVRSGAIVSRLGEKLVETVKVQKEDGEITLDDVNEAAAAAGITTSLFPDKIAYDPEYNGGMVKDEAGVEHYDPNKGFIAQSNPDGAHPTYHQATNNSGHYLPRGWVVIGNKLLNMLSSTIKERRNRGITKLMHERLHEIIHDPNLTPEQLEAWEGIGEVYNLYSSELNKQIDINETALKELLGLPKDKAIDYNKLRDNYNRVLPTLDANKKVELNNQFNRALGLQSLKSLLYNYAVSANNADNKARLLEEFTVEAMTNNLLYTFLNQTKYNGGNAILDRYGKDKNKESLFTKIVNLIKELFNWKSVTDDSLYAKFYDVLRDFANSNHVEEETDLTPPSDTGTASQSATPSNDISEELAALGVDSQDFTPEELAAFGLDPTDTSFKATVEEVSATTLGHIDSLSALKNQLPIELQNNFDSLVDNGYIEFKCTLK